MGWGGEGCFLLFSSIILRDYLPFCQIFLLRVLRHFIYFFFVSHIIICSIIVYLNFFFHFHSFHFYYFCYFYLQSYLFAIVAGDLGSIHSEYKTTSGKVVQLGIFSDKENVGESNLKCDTTLYLD